MSTTLTLVGSARPKSRQGSSIQSLERPPSDDWFVPGTTPRGRRIWYCRFAVTGLFPRLYGPFSSKRKAVCFLDAAISTLNECWAEIDSVRDEHSSEGAFQKLHWGPLIEHPLLIPERHRRQRMDGDQ